MAPDTYTGNIVYTVTSKGVTFALSIEKVKLLCGYTIFTTEHPKLFIFKTAPGKSFVSPPDNILNFDIFTYIMVQKYELLQTRRRVGGSFRRGGRHAVVAN